MSRSVLLLLVGVVATQAFLLEGLGLGGLGGGGGRQCCCQPPPPPPPCGGGGYEAPPPPPPPPMPMYATGGYRNKRANKPSNLEASSGDLFCNSVAVRDVIKQGMNDDEKSSRETITMLLKSQQAESQYVVICSKIHFDFLASTDSEFCSVTNAGLTCSAFTF